MERRTHVKRMLGRCSVIPTSAAHTNGAGRLPAGLRRLVRAGPSAARSVVDVVPTMLYFLGLPVGRDMDGFARTDLFTRAFTAERPIAFIPTYDR